MNSKTLLAGAVALSLGLSHAGATVLLSDNFDSYANQAAFQAAWPITVGVGGQITSTNFVSSANSVRYDQAAARNDRSFTESGNPSALNAITFSFDFYDSNSAASPYREFSALIDGAGSASGQLISLGLNNNQLNADSGGNFYMARILGYTATTVDPNGGPNESSGGTTVASSFFKLNDYGVGLRSTGWHNLAVTITDTTFSFYVDGLLAETVANALTLRSYDIVRLSSGVSSVNYAGFDNVLVEVNPVPEPGTLAFVTLGFGALVAVRRFRK